MKCPKCETKIGFIEGLTILNPLNYRCGSCKQRLSLDSISLKIFFVLLISAAIASFFIYKNITMLKLQPYYAVGFSVLILFVVSLSAYFYFWKKARFVEKNDTANTSGC